MARTWLRSRAERSAICFLLDNFFTAFAGQYNPLNFTQHLWTVAFEEQVYLLIPLLFAAIVWLRRSTPLFALTAVAVVASQPLLRWALTLFHDDETTVWVVPFLHADTIIAGLLLGAGVGSTLEAARFRGRARDRRSSCPWRRLFRAAGHDISQFLSTQTVHLFTLLALAFFLIVLGCLDQGSWIAWLLARQPLVFLGRISYGLYVWHLGRQPIRSESGPVLVLGLS